MAKCNCCQREASDLSELWDGRSYCRYCLHNAHPSLEVAARELPAMECVIRREDLSYWRAIAIFVKVFLVFPGSFFFIAFAVTLLRRDWQNFLIALVLFVIIMVLMSCFVGFGLWGRLILARRQFPRTISIAQGEVTISTAQSTQRVPLAECEWLAGKSTHDEVVAMYLPIRPGIMLLTDKGRFTVTIHPPEVELWEAFLSLARPRQQKPLGCGMSILLGLVSILAGGVLGGLIGIVLNLFWPQPFLLASTIALGIADGLVLVGSYASVRQFGRAVRREYPLLVVPLALMAGGLKLTAGDWRVRGPLVVINALVMMLLVYLAIYRRQSVGDSADAEFTMKAGSVRDTLIV